MKDVHRSDVPASPAVSLAQLENAHERLAEMTADMRLEELAYRGPEGDANSTATLLAHIKHTDAVSLSFVKGEAPPPDPPDDRDAADDLVAPAGARTAAQPLDAHAATLSRVRDYLRGCDDADAVGPVTVPWWPEQGTVRWVPGP